MHLTTFVVALSTMTVPLPDIASIFTARWWVKDKLYDGVTCPCCGQFAKAYRRKISAPMAKVLIEMHRASRRLYGYEWIYLPSLRSAGQDEALLRHWGLIEPKKGLREDGARQQGYWRITTAGRTFVAGETQVRKYARVFNGKLIGYEGRNVSITDALGTKFNYADLMAGR